MKRRTKTLLSIAACLLMLGGVVAWQWRPLVRAYYVQCVDDVTVSLPSCDRVEVYHLGGRVSKGDVTDFPVRPYGNYTRILDRKTLTGSDAESLAALWRSQAFGWKHQAMCHDPAYGVRFYRGSSLKFETSVCFRCSNFYVTAVGESGWWGFDAKTPQAANLLARLEQIFPASVPKSKDGDDPNASLPKQQVPRVHAVFVNQAN